MKNLIILRVDTNNNIDKIIQKQNEIKSFFKDSKAQFDTYLYSYDFNEILENKNIKGKTYFQNFGFLSPSIISEEILLLQDIDTYENIIVAEDDFANDLAVLIAAKLKYKCVTNVNNIKLRDNKFIVSRFSYNNNLLIDYEITNNVVISLRGIKGDLNPIKDEKLEIIKLNNINKCNYILDNKIIKKADEISNFDVLIAVGMGVSTKTEVDKIRKYAKDNNFSFGVTRPIAMRGWALLSEIIGVSGNIYSPKICITIGVSGSAAFYIGIENSDYILSINKDEDASIITLSNSNIIADYKNVIDDVFSYLSNKEFF